MAKNKKVIAALLVLIMLFSIMFANAGSMVTYASDATVLKFDFEDGKLSNWVTRFNAGKLAVTDEKARNGSKSLKASEVGDGWKGLFYDLQSLAVKDRTFTISAWVMQNSGSVRKLTLQAETTKQTAAIYDQKEVASGVWTEFKGTFKLSAEDLGKCDFWIQGENSPGNATEFYLDDVTISYEGGTAAAATATAETIISSDFEAGNGDWQGRGSSIEVSTEASHNDGGKSLKLFGRTQNWQGAQYDVTGKFKAGGVYSISAWVYQKSGEEQKINISVQNEKGAEVQYPQVTEVGIPSGKWTQIKAEYTHNSSYDRSLLYFQAPKADLVFYLDDILVTGVVSKAASYQKDLPSLKDVLKNNFSIGMAVPGQALSSDNVNYAATSGLITKHFNSITCENEMKPDFVLDKDATLKAYKSDSESMPMFDFTRGDAIVKFAQDNKMGVRGHTLVWHSQTPDWLFRQGYDVNKPYVSRDVMLKRMNYYILTVVSHYEKNFPGVVYAWDVVNEAIDPSGDEKGLRTNSNWYSVVGKDYIEQAFKFADAAVKAVNKKDAKGNRAIKLFYNDYSTEDAGKRAAIERLAADLKKKGIIDGVGLQSHNKLAAPSIQEIEKSIDVMSKLGLEVQLTELDIDMHIASDADAINQGYRYKEIFDMLKKKKAVTNVTIWGLTDDRTWLRDGVGDSHSDPLLFDQDFQAKPAFWGIADASKLPVYINKVKVFKNTPKKIDGATELAYDVQTANVIDSKTGSKFSAAWDDKNLYLLINVADAKKDSADSVEVMLDNNGKASQITVTRSNKLSGEKGITSKVKNSGKGYAVELKIPMANLAAAKSIGLDILIKDGKNQYVWNNKKYTGNKVAADYGRLELIAMPKLSEAIKGTAKIDGKIDSAWKKAKVINVNNFSMGKDGATATVRTMWDKDYIYILAEVKDSVLNNANANAWEQDSLEIFIDENNGKTPAYQADDVQYRTSYKNLKTATGGIDIKSFDSATALTKNGYIVEMRIPNKIAKFQLGQVIGFDAQVNNADKTGARVSVSNWNDLTGLGYTNTESLGILKLIQK